MTRDDTTITNSNNNNNNNNNNNITVKMVRIRPKHGENTVNKIHYKYSCAFVGYVYILDVGGDFVCLLCMNPRVCKA